MIPIDCFKKGPVIQRPIKRYNFNQVQAAQEFSIYDKATPTVIHENYITRTAVPQSIADNANAVTNMTYNTSNLFKPITDVTKGAVDTTKDLTDKTLQAIANIKPGVMDEGMFKDMLEYMKPKEKQLTGKLNLQTPS